MLAKRFGEEGKVESGRGNQHVSSELATAEQDPWVHRLKSDGYRRDQAIEELRAYLLKGLLGSLANRDRSLQLEDVVQVALIRILGSIDKFEGRSKFTTWAMAIATRVGISELRRKHYRNASLDDIYSGSELKIQIEDKNIPAAGEGLDRTEILKTLQNLIDTKITHRQRLAVRALLEGLPVEEIASRTKSNRNTVYKLVHDARTKLRQEFRKAGIVADDLVAIMN